VIATNPAGERDPLELGGLGANIPIAELDLVVRSVGRRYSMLTFRRQRTTCQRIKANSLPIFVSAEIDGAKPGLDLEAQLLNYLNVEAQRNWLDPGRT